MARKLILGLAVGLLAGAATAQPKPMDLIVTPAEAATCDHDFSHASGWAWTFETWHFTGVFLWIRGIKPNHIHTVWLKMDPTSPITGLPATPAAPTWGLQKVINFAGTASPAPTNAFRTNRHGDAFVFIPLDFRLSQGIYPFSKFDASLPDTAIGNTPFTFKIISHCTTGVQNGLTPGANEGIFQVSIN